MKYKLTIGKGVFRVTGTDTETGEVRDLFLSDSLIDALEFLCKVSYELEIE